MLPKNASEKSRRKERGAATTTSELYRRVSALEKGSSVSGVSSNSALAESAVNNKIYIENFTISTRHELYSVSLTTF